jgi:uncharacterized protein YbbC (DUF1343 family)
MEQLNNILFGIDVLLAKAAAFNNKRIALVSNNASVTTKGVATRTALLEYGFTIVKLFSPEHGLSAAGEDGSFQHDDLDAITGLPVISLYGNKLAPEPEDLFDVDIVLFDIPDVGCRFYTYLWTMTHVMEACAANNKLLIIADRPNPITGNLSLAEGPMLDENNCVSFIGRFAIPIRHSCTLGELALYFAKTKINEVLLKIIPAENWIRNQANGFVFTPTSPAIQEQSTALLYPGMGLLEGINVNEGRGTHNPFHCCGAPWINADNLQNAFEKNKCPGISSHAISYTPESGLYANELCHGLQFFVTDQNIFRPVKTGIALLQTIINLYPDCCNERLYKTVANPSGAGHLDKLLGISNAFAKLQRNEIIDTSVESWGVLIQQHLLY